MITANEWPKRCTCCARPYYAGEWTTLSFVGYMDDGDGGRLELRNCSCGTTLSIAIEMGLSWALAGDLAEVLRCDARELAGCPPQYAWPPQSKRVVSADDEQESVRLEKIADELSEIAKRGWYVDED